jgi:hypothetical protein
MKTRKRSAELSAKQQPPESAMEVMINFGNTHSNTACALTVQQQQQQQRRISISISSSSSCDTSESGGSDFSIDKEICNVSKALPRQRE